MVVVVVDELEDEVVELELVVVDRVLWVEDDVVLDEEVVDDRVEAVVCVDDDVVVELELVVEVVVVEVVVMAGPPGQVSRRISRLSK